MRILYLFPHPMREELARVQARRAPTDRLYGVLELRARGHQVDIADSRFEGGAGKLIFWAKRRGVNLVDLATLGRLRDYDVVVVKDDFSPLLTAACRVAGRPIVYIDALFQPPRMALKRAFCTVNARAADGVVVYSKRQSEAWVRDYGVPAATFQYLPYTIDTSFYQPVQTPETGARPYVLSVGRDLGRRFGTLVAAMEDGELDLKLVTLPYLLNGIDVKRPWIEVRQNVPYEELLALYAGAAVVAIPLRGDVLYPSGVRGLLEAMALGKAVVSSRSSVLEEYVVDGEGVVYVDAENPAAMRAAIRQLTADDARRGALGAQGAALVRERYDMGVFADGLEAYLASIVRTPRSGANAKAGSGTEGR